MMKPKPILPILAIAGLATGALLLGGVSGEQTRIELPQNFTEPISTTVEFTPKALMAGAIKVVKSPIIDGTTNNVAIEPVDDTAPATINDVQPVPEAEIVEPVLEPAPILVYRIGRDMRFVDISPADQPNTRAEQWCDYTFSDDTVDNIFKGTLTKEGGFSQPISSYNSDNPPGFFIGC